MSTENSFQLIHSEKIESIIHQIDCILKSIDELKRVSPTPKNEIVLMTTKEAMAFLKIQHLNTFKNYLRDNKISPVSPHKPLRFKQSELLKSK